MDIVAQPATWKELFSGKNGLKAVALAAIATFFLLLSTWKNKKDQAG